MADEPEKKEEEDEEEEEKEDRGEGEGEGEDDEPEDEKKADRSARAIYTRQALDVEIRAIAPRGMERLADSLVLERVTVAKARKRFLAELRKNLPSVGSPEPVQTKAVSPAARALGSMSNGEFAAAFGRVGGLPGN